VLDLAYWGIGNEMEMEMEMEMELGASITLFYKFYKNELIFEFF
jgi:hypothetical protein